MKRVFIVGTPRAGTTFLQSIVLSPGTLLALPESHFFPSLSYHRTRPIAAIRNLQASLFLRRWSRSAKLSKTSGVFTSAEQGIMEFRGLLDAAAQEQRLEGWLEKTPRHLYHVDEILAGIPDARFIILTRSAVENVSSLVRASAQWASRANQGKLDSALARWFNDQALVALLGQRDNIMVLDYDDILKDYSACSRRLEKFLDFPEGSILQREELSKIAKSVVTEKETWKANNVREDGQVKRPPPIPEVQTGYETIRQHFLKILE